MRGLISLLVLLCLAARSALSIGPPINTDTPITLGLEGRGVRTFTKVVRASSGPPGCTCNYDALDRNRPYNVTTKGVAGIIVPTVFKELRSGGETVSSSGLGDISLFAKYVAIQVDRHQETFRLAPKVVAKLPTGDEHKAPALGSGSTDFAFGGVAAWLKGRYGLYVDGLYQVSGNANGRQFGNGLTYNLALAYRLSPAVYRIYPTRQINAYLELDGSWRDKNQLNGQADPDSGDHLLFLPPVSSIFL